MNRLIGLALSCVFCVVIAGCGGEYQPDLDTPPTPDPAEGSRAKVEEAKDEAMKSYDGEYKSVPGEEALHQPQSN